MTSPWRKLPEPLLSALSRRINRHHKAGHSMLELGHPDRFVMLFASGEGWEIYGYGVRQSKRRNRVIVTGPDMRPDVLRRLLFNLLDDPECRLVFL